MPDDENRITVGQIQTFSGEDLPPGAFEVRISYELVRSMDGLSPGMRVAMAKYLGELIQSRIVLADEAGSTDPILIDSFEM